MPFELVKPGTNIDFIGKRQVAAFLSVALIVASIAAVAVRGVQWGIDFAGGSELQIRFDAGVPANEGRIREVLTGLVDELTVVRYGDEGENAYLVKFPGNINPEEVVGAADVSGEEAAGASGEEAAGVSGEEAADASGADDRVQRIQAALGSIGPVDIERVDYVGPRVGEELRSDGLQALLWAMVVVLIYITFRFSSRFAPGAIVAVVHDISITAGIFVLLGLEFDLRILAAMLAIMGYSLNDTIIIYDRIRENMRLHTKVDLPDVLNTSVNQTLSRTVLTSATTLLALGSLLILGGEMIRPFALAMILGVLIGTYSSIFIAAPTLLFLETRFGGVAKPAST